VPTIDAIIQVTSVLMARDYAGEAVRTPESLGIAGLSAVELGTL
jgi:opine dehydrogenase